MQRILNSAVCTVCVYMYAVMENRYTTGIESELLPRHCVQRHPCDLLPPFSVPVPPSPV